ncbi:MAG: hypothetical protein IPQ00_07185 [Chloracidobacterium sp.]|nr:hypothetical protein [Chloracidobacterium sp.]
MNRDLLKFHQKRGSFPEKLEDLEGVVWEKKDRNYVSQGRSMIHRNYFYLYSKIDPHRFSLWAVPIGKVRDEALTLFLVGTPTSDRTWKGPALPFPDIENLSAAPFVKRPDHVGSCRATEYPTGVEIKVRTLAESFQNAFRC